MKRKVVFFDHTPILSGGERSLLEILEAFPWEGYEPILVCPSEGPLTVEASKLGVRVEIIPVTKAILKRRRKEIRFRPHSVVWTLIHLVPSVYRLRRLIEREGSSLLVTNSQKAHLIGALASFLSDTPLFWYFRDILPARLRSLILLLGLLPKRIIAISQAVGNQFSTAGRRWGKVVVIPNGIDLNRLRRVASKEKILREFRLPLKSRLVGVVGQIARWKGQRCFIEGAKRVGEMFRDVHFLVVGDVLFGGSGYKKELIQLVNDSPIRDRVTFTGYREDSPSLISAFDILVHTPVEPEPFGRVLVEAMALGKPVVASKSGAAPEIVLDRENGILIPPGDSEALSNALAHFLHRPDIGREMGRRGRERVERFFSIERLIRDLEPILKRISARD